jgi:hypothetical protein
VVDRPLISRLVVRCFGFGVVELVYWWAVGGYVVGV